MSLTLLIVNSLIGEYWLPPSLPPSHLFDILPCIWVSFFSIFCFFYVSFCSSLSRFHCISIQLSSLLLCLSLLLFLFLLALLVWLLPLLYLIISRPLPYPPSLPYAILQYLTLPYPTVPYPTLPHPRDINIKARSVSQLQDEEKARSYTGKMLPGDNINEVRTGCCRTG